MLREYIENMQVENQNKLDSLQREMEEIVTDINTTQKLVERLQYEKRLDSNIFSPRKLDFQADDKIKESQIKIKGLNQRVEYVSQMVEECIGKEKELKNLLAELDEINLKKENLSETLNSFCNNVENETLEQNLIAKSEKIDHNSVAIGKEIEFVSQAKKSENSVTSDMESNVESDIGSGKIPKNVDTESMDNFVNESISKNTFTEHESPVVTEIAELNNELKAESSSENTEEISQRKEKLLSLLNDVYKHNEIALAMVNGNKNRCKSEIRNSMSMLREYAKKVENDEF